MPVLSASLLYQERLALSGAGLFSLGVALAYLSPALSNSDYTWVMEGNYLLWMVLVPTSAHHSEF